MSEHQGHPHRRSKQPLTTDKYKQEYLLRVFMCGEWERERETETEIVFSSKWETGKVKKHDGYYLKVEKKGDWEAGKEKQLITTFDQT